MIRSSAAFLLALPVGVAFVAAPALAQYAPPPPPGAYYQERLPPVVGGYDDEEDLAPPPRNMRRGARALPYPDDEPPLPPPGLYGAPGQRSSGYGQPPYQQPQQPPPMAVAPPRGVSDPDSLRPPAGIGAAPQGSPPSQTAALPPDYQPETGQQKELPPNLKKQLVDYPSREPAGTLIIDTPNTYLYLVLGGGKALRYGIGVGREGFTWTGTERISRMSEWPDWHPPSEMIDRQPYLPRFMAGGPGNPLGARALYLGKTLYRIHGTNQPSTIGTFVSSGCIRLINEDVEDLYSRVQVGTRVVVLPGRPPENVSNGAGQSAANGAVPAGTPVYAPSPSTASVPRSYGGGAISSSPLPPPGR
jgi:lipoprotein-anchoring transpeptidase ErfK/SrfK